MSAMCSVYALTAFMVALLHIAYGFRRRSRIALQLISAMKILIHRDGDEVVLFVILFAELLLILALFLPLETVNG